MREIMIQEFRDFLASKDSNWYFHETFLDYMVGFGYERNYSDLKNEVLTSRHEKDALNAIVSLGDINHDKQLNNSLVMEYGDNGFDSLIKAIKHGKCVPNYARRKQLAGAFIRSMYKTFGINSDVSMIKVLASAGNLPYDNTIDDCISLLSKINK